jgi:Pentapeptide repeats (8 copies)
MSETDQRFNREPAASADTPSPYPSFLALEQAHLGLRQRFYPVDPTSKVERPSAAEVQAFINRIVATGIVLSERVERRAAQSILDYWTTQLSSLDDVDARSLTPQLLAPYDAARAGQVVNDRAATDSGRAATESGQGEQAREIIRLAATARLYQDSGTPGFLLSGKALEVARKFVDLDEDIAALVAASDRQIRNRRRQIIGVGIGAAAAVAILFVSVFQYGIPHWKQRTIDGMAQARGKSYDQKVIMTSLNWLSMYQPYMLAGASRDFPLNALEFVDIDIRNLRLVAPHFKYSTFRSTKFHRAELPYSVFNNSVIERAELFEANLEGSRFDEAIVRSSDFAGANLKGAVFTQSRLCSVDLSGADLDNAVFFAVSLDEKTRDSLAKTAWWLASGWSWNQFTKLNARTTDRDLSTAKAFRNQLVDHERGVREARQPADRAYALGALALLRTKWGIGVRSNEGHDAASTRTDDAAFCARTTSRADIPATVEGATRGAICLLNSEPDNSYIRDLEGMLGYAILQGRQLQDIPSDQLSRAVSLLERGTEGWNKEDINRHWLMFAYAAAQYMLWKRDGAGSKAKALADLQSVLDAGHIPTHELRHLGQALGDQEGQGEFLDRVATAVKGRWPDTTEKSCS